METVVLDGVEYVKASVIAREFKYTSDYVGQLCRSRKIDARLVGRSWFVNPTSLRAHKKNKYQKSAAENTVQNGDTAHKIKIERKQVGPVIKNKTMKSLYDASLNMRQSQTGEKKLRVNYERDDEVLFPEITRKRTPAPRSLPIVPAGSKRLHISANKTNISFVAGELPDVALSGSLSVVGLEEPDKTTEEEKADLDRKIEQKAAKAIAKQHPQLKSIKTSVQADNNQKNKATLAF